jgi:hypothetical protein
MLDIAVAKEPTRAVKVSRLVLSRSGAVMFAPTFRQSRIAHFLAEDRAVCASFAAHPAPQSECTCGFYAVHDLENLHRFAPVPSSAVVLTVSLGGHIIEHDYGLRASHQLAHEMLLPDRCVRCGDAAPCAFLVQPSWCLERELHAVCVLCARLAPRRVLTLSDVAGRLGITVKEVPLRLSHLWAREPSKRSYACVAGAFTLLASVVAWLCGASLLLCAAVFPLVTAYLTFLLLEQPLQRRSRIASSAMACANTIRFLFSPVRYRRLTEL